MGSAYESTCAECGHLIEVGDEIALGVDGDVVHLECRDTEDA